MRRIFSLLYEIDVDKGGITSAMLSRSYVLTEKGYHIDLVTLDKKNNYPEIEQQLKLQGRMHPNVRILNVYQFYKDQHLDVKAAHDLKEHIQLSSLVNEPNFNVDSTHYEQKKEADYFLRGLLIKQKKWDENENLISIDYYNENRYKIRKEEFDKDGWVDREIIFSPETGKPNQIRYLARDGFCYLTEWYNAEKLEGISLFSRQSPEVKKFKDNHAFHTFWLEQLCEKENMPIIICDGVGSASKVNAMKAGIAKRLYCVHSNHLDFPHTLGSPVRKNHKYVMEHIKDYDGLIVLTHEQKEDILKDFEAKDNIFVIPHAPRKLNIPGKTKKKENEFVMIARYHEEKGIEKAIGAMDIVKGTHPNIVLNIYGSGPHKPQYEELIKKKKLTNVVLHEYTSDPAKQYKQALATLLTSKFEGFSLAICESFSCGTPVISFDVKYSPRELIAQNSAGLIVEYGNVEQLAESIIYLYEHPQKALEFGENGKNTIESLYSQDRLIERWEQVFEHIG
ncbi:glycosyltransferase [Bacillus sp. LBG-1-113]|uniref:glycosyltransferase n=1 Tax=Bacillus sp. LBG-1-113 TaxID=2886094 RepID=UPI001E604886|nr:glycosyltransferase [Bacillus sp. LBG-1-113]MCC2931125.1 glycosyltransferase [Bacillus sp. LBG-1-113]